MSKHRLLVSTVLLFALSLISETAIAQTLGTFRWNLAPYCNVITLTVTQSGAGFSAVGSDDGCGLVQPTAVSANFIANGGSVSGVLMSVPSGGAALLTTIQVNASSLSGSWSDNAGNSGNFVFNPTTAPGLQRPVLRELWAYVISNGGLHASSGNLSVTHPATGQYCVVIPKRYSYKAAQATLADPGGNKIVSVGTGHGSLCNPLSTTTQDAIPVYVVTTAGAYIDGNFTIAVPLQ